MKYISGAEVESIEFTRHANDLQIATFDATQNLGML